MRVIVIGGGIAGLTAGFLADQAGHDVIVVDPSPSPGGLIRTETHDGFLCETGPQAIMDDAPDSLALLQALNLDTRLVPASRAAKRRFIFARGHLRPVPMSPPALLSSGLLSVGGKLRLLSEPWIRRASLHDANDDHESIAAFGQRRLGQEASQTLLSTATIGIYAGETTGLSMASAFPRIANMEREHGSLFRGVLAGRKVRNPDGSVTPRKASHPVSFPGGLGELVDAMVSRLGRRVVRARATELRPLSKAQARWQVSTEGNPTGVFEAESVILAATASSATSLLRPVLASSPGVTSDGAEAALSVLTNMRRAPIALVCLGFRDATSSSMGMDLDAYGFLVARGEKPLTLGCQYESSIFPGRAPDGSVLLRVILGGVGAGFDPGIIDQPDDIITSRALGDLRSITGLKRDPDLVRIWRHADGIPQYAPGHAARRATFDNAIGYHPGLYVIGHSLRGVGVNEGIRAASETIRQLHRP